MNLYHTKAVRQLLAPSVFGNNEREVRRYDSAAGFNLNQEKDIKMSTVLTPKFRVSYPNIFKPVVNKLSGQSEYSLQALFPKGTDLTKLKQVAKEVAEAKWGKDKLPKNLKSPFRDQSDRAKEDEETGKTTMPAGYEAGAIYMNLKSKQRPSVVDQKVEEIIDDSQFYAGCWARASIVAFAYDQAGNKGVSFALRNIQKVADGDPLSGRTTAQDDFSPVDMPAQTSAKITNEGASATDLFN